jgi:sodium/hydrogen exchanger 8
MQLILAIAFILRELSIVHASARLSVDDASARSCDAREDAAAEKSDRSLMQVRRQLEKTSQPNITGLVPTPPNLTGLADWDEDLQGDAARNQPSTNASSNETGWNSGVNSTDEAMKEAAVAGALGFPGKGMDSETPLTVPDESIKGNNALFSVHSLAIAIVLPASGIYLLSLLLASFLGSSDYTSFIPDSVNIIGAAILLGLLVRKMIAYGLIDFHDFTLVNSTVLNLFLLPIIIFNSGWSLNKGNFMSQFEHIHIFAIFGTVISTFVIGGLSYLLGSYGWHHVSDFRSNLIFGALISAVDPVATLATYSKLGLPEKQPLLNTLVFGESVINDAVAIVIFDVVNEGWDDLSVGNAIGQVSKLLFGSLILGVGVAAIMLWLMKKARLKGDALHEILFLHMTAYCIFALAESVYLSGIIAGLFGGMLMGVYGPRHFTKDGAKLATEYLEIAGVSADTWVFILCGTSTALLNKADGVLFGIIGVVLCLVGRAVSVPACAAACNFMKRYQGSAGHAKHITWQIQFMMWHGGLRGGIALVLALEVNAEWCNNKGAILNATFLIICTLLLVLGSTTEFLLRHLGMEGDEGSAEATGSLWDDDGAGARFCARIDPLIRPMLVGHDEDFKEG